MTRWMALASALFFAAPSVGSAETVTVLGLRSVEGDDDMAQNLTSALRAAARGVSGWQVSAADISLVQMTLVQGCNEPDAECMATIAGQLGQDRIIYGTLRRNRTGANYDYAVTLYAFDARSNSIGDPVTDTIPSSIRDIDPLRAYAERYIARFAGLLGHGSLRVDTNTPDAAVFIDDAQVGTTNAAGGLELSSVAEGVRQLRVEAVDHENYEGEIRVLADEANSIRVNLVVAEGPNLGWLPGTLLSVAGAAMLGVGIANWTKIRAWNAEYDEVASLPEDERRNLWNSFYSMPSHPLAHDSLWQTMLLGAAPGQQVCPGLYGIDSAGDEVIQAQARALCEEQASAQLMTYLFTTLGGLALAGGITWVAVSLVGDDDEERSTSFRLTPSFTTQSGELRARFDF